MCDIPANMPSPRSCRVVHAYQDVAAISCMFARHDQELRRSCSNVRHKHAILSCKDEKVYKNASKGCALRQRVRSWDLFAPFFHLRDRRESPTLPLDHAEFCAQTIRENAGGNGAYLVLPGMIWDSACPPQKYTSALRARGLVGQEPSTSSV